MQKKVLKNNELPDTVYCPLYKKEIDTGDCFDLSMTIDKLAPRAMTKFNIEDTPGCEKTCKNCKWHDV